MRCVNGSCTSSVKKHAQVLPKGHGQIAVINVFKNQIVLTAAIVSAKEKVLRKNAIVLAL
jgi:hypothetical protein